MLLVPAVVALLPLVLQVTDLRPNTAYLAWVGGATALLIAALLLTLRLETRLDATGVHYRMAPLHRSWRHQTWSQISRAYVRSYDPLGEYGGWGLKGFGSNRALNIAGSDGFSWSYSAAPGCCWALSGLPSCGKPWPHSTPLRRPPPPSGRACASRCPCTSCI
ncbi:hypothetical protein [Hymenobacter oligotrophus]|uniref:hypothetical protein n=1 Tax=Hymenobacter oligotrophus TaxID=2319843 RepID=UPI0013C300F7|nr:hypothetical protein [Hymenobacter oligotrophus]